MTAIACLFLLISCSIAGQATPTSSFATPPAAQSPGIRGTDELHEMLAKRTSGSSSNRRLSPNLQSTGFRPASATYIPRGPLFVPHVLEEDNSRSPALSMAIPSAHVPADGPSVSHSALASRNMRHFDINKRPTGSLKNDLALQAQAEREYRDRRREMIKSGELVNKKKADGSEYTVKTIEELRAYGRLHTCHFRSKLTPEGKKEMYRLHNERRRRNRAKRREQQKAEKEGRIWRGSPVRKPGRPRRAWEQKPAGMGEGRRDVTVDTRLEGGTQHAVDVAHALPTTLSTPALSTGPSSHASLPEAPYQLFPPGPSSSSLDPGLSLLPLRSSVPEQRQTTRASRREASPLAAGTREEKRLRLTLAPPGQQDRLRLTLAPPRHD